MENKDNHLFISEAIHTAYIDHKINITLNKWKKKQRKAEIFLDAIDDFFKSI